MKQIRQIMLIAICLLGVAMWAQQTPPAQGDNSQAPAGHDKMGHGQMGHGQMGHGQMGHGQGMSADEHLQMLAQKLNLTDDQKAKIKPILEQHMQERQAIMKDQSLSQAEKHSKMQASMESAHSKIEPILTEDQKKQFAEMMKDMHGGAAKKGESSKSESSPK